MRSILVLILLFNVNFCYANWVLIDKNAEYELYVFKPSILKTNQGFRFTWLYNYYKENRAGTRRTGYYSYQSYGFDEEVNCVTKESRLFSSSPFSYPMGEGLITINTMNPKWESVFGDRKGAGIKSIFSKIC
jgi:hypothetical protein